MNKKLVYTIGFIGMVLAQWLVPAKMILERNEVLSSGKLFKFITAPVDPNDPFRGKYVALEFENNHFETELENDFEVGGKVFVIINNDGQGYAEIRSYSKNRPEFIQNYLEVVINRISVNDGIQEVFITYPFDRFYLEEFQAEKAEKIYLEAFNDRASKAWAEVYIKEGKAVLRDVLIEGRSLRDFD